jgi:hypothetical protein
VAGASAEDASSVLARFSKIIVQAARKLDRQYVSDYGEHRFDYDEIMLEAQVCVCTVAGLMHGLPSFYGKLAEWPEDQAERNMTQVLNEWLQNWAKSAKRALRRQAAIAPLPQCCRDARDAAEHPDVVVCPKHGDLSEIDGTSSLTYDVPDANAADLMAEVEFADVWAKYPTVAAIIRDGYTEQELAEREGVSQPAIHYRYKRELSRIKSELDLAA